MNSIVEHGDGYDFANDQSLRDLRDNGAPGDRDAEIGTAAGGGH
jgi:hypothetical protein